MPSPEFIAALEEEKRGYEQRGLKDRAAAVDAQLKHHKSAKAPVIETPEDNTPEVETATIKKSK